MSNEWSEWRCERCHVEVTRQTFLCERCLKWFRATNKRLRQGLQVSMESLRSAVYCLRKAGHFTAADALLEFYGVGSQPSCLECGKRLSESLAVISDHCPEHARREPEGGRTP